MSEPLERYRSLQVQTAGREQLLLLLFDGAAVRLRAAIHALQGGDWTAANQPAWRAQAIILELLQTLDAEHGGELAENLGRLYIWWNHEILTGVLHKDPTPLQAVLEQVQQQRRAWAEAAAHARSG